MMFARIFIWTFVSTIAAQLPSFGQNAHDERKELDAEFWSDVPNGAIVRPCEPESEDARVATDALRELDARIAELDAGDAHEPIARAILDLLHTACFRLAVEADRLPRPDSAESLLRWWDDGGSYWLSSYIELPEKRINGVPFLQIVVPPDDRPTLSRSGRRHLYGPLLCPDDDEVCRAETAGWRRRAEESIEKTPDHPRVEKLDVDSDEWHWTLASAHDVLEEAVQKACVEGSPSPSSYQKFRQCVGRIVPRRPLLPLGAIRVPSSGWLLVAGRRGHYQYCDELNAYNLSNGDAFRARRCSGLVLEEGGHVDFDETERRAIDELDAGFLNVSNLREAAWMLLIFPEMMELRARAAFVDLPPGMERVLEKGTGRESSFGGASVSTAQTTLLWSITHPDFGADGDLVWPFSYHRAEDYVTKLLEIAEAGWQDGCPAAPPNASALSRLYPGANDGDTDVDAFQATMQRLKLAIASWSPEHCSDPND